MLRRCVATCSWVFEDSEVSGRALVYPTQLAMGFIHRFLVGLDAPRDCMSFFDFDPAHNVRLFKSAFPPRVDLNSAYLAVDLQLL
jgi:hypothetical protein